MIFVMKKDASRQAVEAFAREFKEKGFEPFIRPGTERTSVCLIGNTAAVDLDAVVETSECVEYGRRVTEPYKRASRATHPEDSLIPVGDQLVGEGHFAVIAGPCSIESEEQMQTIAARVKAAGATMLRGGAFKPRSSPYSFQGMGVDGLKLLKKAGSGCQLPIVTELMEISDLQDFDQVDVVQIGARNMQNFKLLMELGHTEHTILLKRGLSSTIEELLLAAEYILAGGNERVILCERGIRTFETETRNTLDLSAIPVLKKKTHLPVIVDPSHGTGRRDLVPVMARAAIAAGADGLLIEVHNDPTHALCDGAQSLDCDQFDVLMQDLKRRIAFEGKVLG
ncbi:MAG: 3-deoxy-7-phosphoheptulonate synthase [Eubacterium sp.]|jgi:3-deoxy-7-phosphoheptulonate synthase